MSGTWETRLRNLADGGQAWQLPSESSLTSALQTLQPVLQRAATDHGIEGRAGVAATESIGAAAGDVVTVDDYLSRVRSYVRQANDARDDARERLATLGAGKLDSGQAALVRGAATGATIWLGPFSILAGEGAVQAANMYLSSQRESQARAHVEAVSDRLDALPDIEPLPDPPGPGNRKTEDELPPYEPVFPGGGGPRGGRSFENYPDFDVDPINPPTPTPWNPTPIGHPDPIGPNPNPIDIGNPPYVPTPNPYPDIIITPTPDGPIDGGITTPPPGTITGPGGIGGGGGGGGLGGGLTSGLAVGAGGAAALGGLGRATGVGGLGGLGRGGAGVSGPGALSGAAARGGGLAGGLAGGGAGGAGRGAAGAPGRVGGLAGGGGVAGANGRGAGGAGGVAGRGAARGVGGVGGAGAAGRGAAGGTATRGAAGGTRGAATGSGPQSGTGSRGVAGGGVPAKGAGGSSDRKNRGLGGPIAPHLDDDAEFGPRSEGAGAGGRD